MENIVHWNSGWPTRRQLFGENPVQALIARSSDDQNTISQGQIELGRTQSPLDVGSTTRQCESELAQN
jgi:hypothetical protein